MAFKSLDLSVQFTIGCGEYPGQRRSLIMFAGGMNFTQAGGFPEKVYELVVFLSDMAQCQPFAKNNRPGQQGKSQQQQQYYLCKNAAS